MKPEELLPLFKNLSDENRFAIFILLVNRGELNVGEICEKTGLSQPLTSHHLKNLREVGLVNCRRDGNNIYYSACGEKLKWFCGAMHNELQAKLEEGFDGE